MTNIIQLNSQLLGKNGFRIHLFTFHSNHTYVRDTKQLQKSWADLRKEEQCKLFKELLDGFRDAKAITGG